MSSLVIYPIYILRVLAATIPINNIPIIIIFSGADNNENTVIRNTVTGTIIDAASTPNLLSCDYLTSVWIEWGRAGELKVGKGGTLFQYEVLTVEIEAEYSIGGYFVETSEGNLGHWDVVNVEGQ